ncbi:MAG: triose-phosphate isomerase [Candidatus Zixiibacteriota bacterium]
MRRKIIAGNWKMNGTLAETDNLIRALLAGDFVNSPVQVVVCPPFTALETASRLLKGTRIALGAQDMSPHPKGAFTGDISATMLLTLGATFVILGHSERRQYHSESDQLINAKARQALTGGLTPIVCVGETLAERESGRTEAVVGEQVAGTLAGFSADDLKKTVIAYEPVWAIGTGRTATPEMAEAVHCFVRDKLAAVDRAAAQVVQILYGGSVNAMNAAGLLSQPNIDGALVGGASLKADEFIAIIKAA